MISPKELFKIFNSNNLTFFTGVPDSTFKGWMSFLEKEHGKKLTQIIAANECEAISVASGYHLSTGKIGVVYMQNSGLGKTVNPLTSICDPDVYSIPLILMVGWRGEPGKKDEPQHKKMGKIMIPLLETLKIPYRQIPSDINEGKKVIREIKNISMKSKKPVALIVKKGIITTEDCNEHSDNEKNKLEMKREDAIKAIIDKLKGNEIIVSTTGKTSRELYEYRIERKEKPRDFYTVGGMGCAAAISLGIALHKPKKKIFVFDGDGSIIMQMGSLATIGHYKPENLNHIVFDNCAHDSTGGQTTVSKTVDFKKIAVACGYKNVKTVEKKKDLTKAIKNIFSIKGPNMIIVNVKKGSRENLGRPTTTPKENKDSFMQYIKER